MKIKDKKGIENVMTDHLFRLENCELEALVEGFIIEEFLDAY